MSTDPATHARLREIADQLPKVPGLGKTEIAHGQIVMMLSPVRRHELAVLRIARQLNAQLPHTHAGFIAHPGADLEDVGLGRLRCPDLRPAQRRGRRARSMTPTISGRLANTLRARAPGRLSAR